MKLLIIIFLINSAIVCQAQKFEDLAKTPPMGWNSWNKFHCDVSEKLIREIADAMVESGMRDAGYKYIVIDDCWQVSRDAQGNIVPDPERFPSGMKALGDYIHGKGLKFGIYSCAGSLTCQGRPASRGYQFQDARTYASWGVDYLKYDWCNSEEQNAKAAYKTMSDALKACARPIVFSICEWGDNKPWEWGAGIGHLWRTTSDICDCYDCVIDWGGLGVVNIIDKQAELQKYAGPGHWNDPDMLEVGNGGMTDDEYKTHFSMWSMLAAPLMAGNDLRNMNKSTKEILTNTDVIAINQDKLGQQATRFMDMGETEIWAKPLMNGEIAICFMNRTNQVWKLDYNWQKQIMYFATEVDLKKKIYNVYDVWEHKAIGKTNEKLVKNVPAHGIVMVHLSEAK